jgi:uncharacterized protein YicC (UPF0701 family)
MARKNPSANNPEVIDKERRVLELRRSGITFDVIAEEVGYASASGAYNAFVRSLKRTLQVPADEVRQIEIDRLDKLQQAMWPQAMEGHPAAIDRIIRIMERRAKLLGLDAPTKLQQEVTVYEVGTDIDREVQRLAELLATGSRIKSDVATPVSPQRAITA